MSISRCLRFITAEVIDNRKETTLVKALKQIHGVNSKRGFCIVNIRGDSEFECTCGAIATDIQFELHICGEDKHVPDIECCIRTVKEHTRCTYNMTPFEHFLPCMIIEIVFLNVFWLNVFPNKLSVLQTISPRTIVTGLEFDYNKHCCIQYGQYAQTHEKHNNTMVAQIIGALALRPTGNQ